MLPVARQLIIGLAFVACARSFAQLTVQAETHTHGDVYLLHESCEQVINEQINWETYASLVYLNMAGYFDRPSVAKPGFAKFFRDQSLEEYGHANKFIDYINKRNGTVRGISVESSDKFDWSSPREALRDAIKLEKHVFGKIQHLHSVADQKCNDAHLTDFLESYFFVEQVDSIRQLQAMLSTLTVDEPAASAVIEHMEDNSLWRQYQDDQRRPYGDKRRLKARHVGVIYDSGNKSAEHSMLQIYNNNDDNNNYYFWWL